MRGAADRGAKRDVIVIDDDESKKEEPAEKSARRETEASSPSVILPARQETTEATGSVDGRERNVFGLPPLEQFLSLAEQFKSNELRRKLLESDEKLAKSEQKFQRVCTISGELKARVQFLENIIDKKPNIVVDTNKDRRIEELEKKLIDVSNQLEEERKGRMQDRNSLSEQPYELEEGEIPPSTDEISRVESAGYSTNILELCSIDSCDTEWIPYRVARTMLKTSLNKCHEDSRRRCIQAWRKLKIHDCVLCGVKIRNVNSLFTHFFSKIHAEKCISSGQGLSMSTVNFWLKKMEHAKSSTVIHNECHPTNLFQLCRSDLQESLSFDRAHDLLQSAFNKYQEYNKNRGRVNKYIRDQTQFPTCEVCRYAVGKIQQLCFHMFGKFHGKKVKTLGANVSLAAVNYWIRQLEEADVAVRSGRMKDDSATAAAGVESNKTIVLIELD